MNFEWDPDKNAENFEKHRVSFEDARLAWLDPHRVSRADKRHSGPEERRFLFGRVGDDVLTVRYTRDGDTVRIISGAGYWRDGRGVYEHGKFLQKIGTRMRPPSIAEEIKASVPIDDDFPSPEELRRELKRSVTIRLDPDVYTWFKLPGPRLSTRINAVLRQYMKLYRTAAKPSGQLIKRGAGMCFVAAKFAPRAAAKAKAARPYGKKKVTKARTSKAKQKRALRT